MQPVLWGCAYFDRNHIWRVEWFKTRNLRYKRGKELDKLGVKWSQVGG